MDKRNALASEIITDLIKELKDDIQLLDELEKNANDTLTLIRDKRIHAKGVLQEVGVLEHE